MWPNPQEIADLVTFTEKILNGKLYFLCSDRKKFIVSDMEQSYAISNLTMQLLCSNIFIMQSPMSKGELILKLGQLIFFYSRFFVMQLSGNSFLTAPAKAPIYQSEQNIMMEAVVQRSRQNP